MKKKIIAVVWNDVIEYGEEELNEENFSLAKTIQTGILYDEDNEKIRLVHSFSLDNDEHDFVVIPKALIVDQKELGTFDTKTYKISIK
mgnify:FL=1